MENSKGSFLNALVVEDQELFREAIRDELHFQGINAATSVDGEEGLQAAMSSKFDFILSDIRMPKRDGRWLLSELRKVQKCAPPFIFMSGFTDLSPQDAFDMGADGFLGKPVNTDRLHEVISKVCQPMESRWSVRPTANSKQSLEMKFASLQSSDTKEKISFGRGGMFLATHETVLRVGDLLEFRIQFEDGPMKLLAGAGTVLWKREGDAEEGLASGYGIDFEYLTEDSLSDWIAYCQLMKMVAFVPKK